MAAGSLCEPELTLASGGLAAFAARHWAADSEICLMQEVRLFCKGHHRGGWLDEPVLQVQRHICRWAADRFWLQASRHQLWLPTRDTHKRCALQLLPQCCTMHVMPSSQSGLLLVQSMRRCSVPSALIAQAGAIRRWQRLAKYLTPAMVTLLLLIYSFADMHSEACKVLRHRLVFALSHGANSAGFLINDAIYIGEQSLLLMAF